MLPQTRDFYQLEKAVGTQNGVKAARNRNKLLPPFMQIRFFKPSAKKCPAWVELGYQEYAKRFPA